MTPTEQIRIIRTEVKDMAAKRGKKNDPRSGRPAVDGARRTQVGQVIREYRTAAGMDRSELAQRLGYTRTAVGNWESGLTRPDIDTLPRLCEVLRIPITELLGLPDGIALPGEERGILDMYRRLDKYDRHTVRQLMDRLLFRQDSAEKARLRSDYAPLRLYEEAASAGIGVPMTDGAGSTSVYVLKSGIPGNADCIIRVNGTSMEPTFRSGECVYVNSRQTVSPGQIGIFIVNGEAFIKEYRPEGLVSHNRRYRTIAVGGDADVRCCGRVTGPVGDGDIVSGPLLEKIETAFEEARE